MPSFPVPDEIGDEVARPADAALQHGEAELRKAVRDAAEDERSCKGVAGICEVADVIVGEAPHRFSPLGAHAAGVRGDRDFQIDAALPERVVVVRALEPERVHVEPDLVRLGAFTHEGRHRPPHVVRDHQDLEPEFTNGVRRLLDRLVRRVHGHDRRRRDPVRVRLEHLRVHPVDRAGHGAPDLLVGVADPEKPERGVEDAEVDAEVVQSFVEEPRDHGGRAIERPGRLTPPGRAMDAPSQSFLGGDVVPGRVRGLLDERFDDRGACDVAQVVEEDRHRFEPVTVTVDDGMVESSAHRRGLRMLEIRHGVLLHRNDVDDLAPMILPIRSGTGVTCARPPTDAARD